MFGDGAVTIGAEVYPIPEFRMVAFAAPDPIINFMDAVVPDAGD
jgi:hypothetical protein